MPQWRPYSVRTSALLMEGGVGLRCGLSEVVEINNVVQDTAGLLLVKILCRILDSKVNTCINALNILDEHFLAEYTLPHSVVR
jgi:hypothetical protein